MSVIPMPGDLQNAMLKKFEKYSRYIMPNKSECEN